MGPANRLNGIRYGGGANLVQALWATWEPVVPMVREKPKWRTHEGESTDAGHRGGPTRSSVEVSVMEMERRGWIIWSYGLANQ